MERENRDRKSARKICKINGRIKQGDSRLYSEKQKKEKSKNRDR